MRQFNGRRSLANVALHNPARVAGLILIDSAGVKVNGAGSLAPGYVSIPIVGRVLTAIALTTDKLVREGLGRVTTTTRKLPMIAWPHITVRSKHEADNWGPARTHSSGSVSN